MTIRGLTPAEASIFQALRLTALRDQPTAFGSSYEEEKDFAIAAIEDRLAVAPDRGHGLGRALLLEALALARSAPGIRQVNLCVNAGSVGAIRLYQSLGFQAFGHESGAMFIQGVLHDELHMALQLRG